ncbi:FAD-dependent monooxygenase [Streptomyces sp.]|uniref:FAD-dependent monooxygenase n=1 Tax=Streptomyces sp. TaxID=1931 RepID=UPI002F40F54B
MTRVRPAGTDVDVLVVGAGPTGLLAACELLRRSVRVRVIDHAPQPSTATKALSLWPRALDILDDVGIGTRIRQLSNRIDAFSYFSERRPLASFGFREDLASRIVPQHVTERLLTERLHELGGTIERGVRLRWLEGPDYSGRIDTSPTVTAVLQAPDRGLEAVPVPFLIGADGAGSTVRGQLGIGFLGSTYEMAFALVDARIDGALPSNEIRYYQSGTGTLVVVPCPDGVYRFLSVAPRDEREVGVPMMQAVLDERGPRGVRIAEPVWQAVFRVHARHATSYQLGRVFLMGDAAHVHSPAGGQGMNNGLQDAHNLGWKLASVIHGTSPSSLLETYGRERSEATRRIVRDTDLQTRAWGVRGTARVAARDAAFRLADRTGVVSRGYTPVMAGRRLAYVPERETQHPSGRAACRVRHCLPGGVPVGSVFPGPLPRAGGGSGGPGATTAWTLAVVPPRDPAWMTELGHVAARSPLLRVVRLDAGSARVTGCGRPGYYLIRPDGHIAAHGHARDLNRLETEVRHVLTPAGRPPDTASGATGTGTGTGTDGTVEEGR